MAAWVSNADLYGLDRMYGLTYIATRYDIIMWFLCTIRAGIWYRQNRQLGWMAWLRYFHVYTSHCFQYIRIGHVYRKGQNIGSKMGVFSIYEFIEKRRLIIVYRSALSRCVE